MEEAVHLHEALCSLQPVTHQSPAAQQAWQELDSRVRQCIGQPPALQTFLEDELLDGVLDALQVKSSRAQLLPNAAWSVTVVQPLEGSSTPLMLALMYPTDYAMNKPHRYTLLHVQ